MVGVAAAVLAVDQLTKWWALEELADGDIDLVWTLRFRLVWNSGSAFSLGASLGPIFGLAAVVIAVVLVRLGRTVPSRWGVAAVGLILGGALGNLGDRLFRAGDGFLGGRVVDFIDLQWWPVFNVADIGIVVGGVLLVLVASRLAES